MERFFTTFFVAMSFFAAMAQDSPLIKRARNYSDNAVAFADDRILDGIANKTIAIEKLSDAEVAGVYASTIGSPPGSPWIDILDRDLMSRPNAWKVLLMILQNPKHNTLRGRIWGWLSYHPNYPHADELLSESIKIFKSEGAELGAIPLMGLANFIAYAGTPEDTILFDKLEKAGGIGISLARQRYVIRLNTEKEAANAGSQTVSPKSPKSSNDSESDASVLTNKKPTSSTPWSLVAVLIVAAIGLLWLVLKNRK